MQGRILFQLDMAAGGVEAESALRLPESDFAFSNPALDDHLANPGHERHLSVQTVILRTWNQAINTNPGFDLPFLQRN